VCFMAILSGQRFLGAVFLHYDARQQEQVRHRQSSSIHVTKFRNGRSTTFVLIHNESYIHFTDYSKPILMGEMRNVAL